MHITYDIQRIFVLFEVFCFRAYSMVDSSRLFTFVISILLIVYGSFR